MTKKVITKSFLVLGVLLSVWIHAQTHRFIYEYQYKPDSTATEFRKDNMVLDINPDEVKFYDYYLVTIDSANITKGQGSVVWNDLPAVMRKKNSFTNTNYDVVDMDMFTYETHDEMKWQLSQETKKVGEHSLQKATTRFGGRVWEAWFETEMPFIEGPYKFRGLPGLIFEISDTEGNFKFTLVKSYKLPKTYDTSRFLGQLGGRKALAVKENVVVKQKLALYKDPLRSFREEFKKYPPTEDRTYMVFNTKVTSLDQFKELTEIVQKIMRKENNPIERNRAIQYK